jgi:AcrR family transcriptional regulator
MAAPESPPARAETAFSRRRAATRAELLRLGLERFPRKGYSGTTVDDIVRDSGYTRGAFYFHFPGKEDFFLHLLRARAELRDEWWLVARDPALPDLRAAVTATLAHLDALEDGGAQLMLIADFFQTVGGRLEYTEPLRELYRTWIVELTAFVTELRGRGFARLDVPAEALGAEIFATAEGHTIHRALYNMPGDGLIDALVRIIRP